MAERGETVQRPGPEPPGHSPGTVFFSARDGSSITPAPGSSLGLISRRPPHSECPFFSAFFAVAIPPRHSRPRPVTMVTPSSTHWLPTVVVVCSAGPPWLPRSALHCHGAFLPRCSTGRSARFVVRLCARLPRFAVRLVPPPASPFVRALFFGTFRSCSHLLFPRLPLPRRPGPAQTASEVTAPASGTLLELVSAAFASQLVVASAPPATSQRFYRQSLLLSAPAIIRCHLGPRPVRGAVL